MSSVDIKSEEDNLAPIDLPRVGVILRTRFMKRRKNLYI